jgi:hypothetical protein
VGSYIDLVELIALVAQGKVTSHNPTYPLGAVNDVLNDLKQGRLQGARHPRPRQRSRRTPTSPARQREVEAP